MGVVALTVIPHLFRHYTGFAVACWSAAILIMFAGLIVYSIGRCLWLPTQVLLVVAALIPPTQPVRTTVPN